MEQVARIFDYFKRAYILNKTNRALYLPQIALILLKISFYIIFGLLLFEIAVSVADCDFSFWMLKDSFFKSLVWWIVMIVLYSLASVIVESGLFNMYRSCLLNEELEKGAFKTGAAKYFFRFLLADLLMILAWILFLIPYIFIGIFTLLAGFVLIPLLIAVFTTMWKVTMVMEDARLIESLKRGMRFAKNHFWSLGVLVILQRAFLSLPSSGGSSNSNAANWNTQGDPKEMIPGSMENGDMSFLQWYSDILPYIKIGFYILIPIVSIAVILGSLVGMVFQIFFGLSIFIMYFENEVEENEELLEEVL